MVKLIVPKPRLAFRGWPVRARFRIAGGAEDEVSEYSFDAPALPHALITGPDHPFDGIVEGVTAFAGIGTVVMDLLSRDATVPGSAASLVERREWQIQVQKPVVPQGLGIPLRYYVGEQTRARVRISTFSDTEPGQVETVAELDVELEQGEVVADVLAVCGTDLAARRQAYRLPELVVDGDPVEYAQRIDPLGARPYQFTILSLDAQGPPAELVRFPPVWVLDAERPNQLGKNLGSYLGLHPEKRIVQPPDTPEVLRYVNDNGDASVSLTVGVTQGPFSRAYSSRPLLEAQALLSAEPTACAAGPRGLLVAGKVEGRLQIIESRDGGASWNLLADITESGIVGGRTEVKIAEVWYRAQVPMGLIVSTDKQNIMRVFELRRLSSGSYNPALVVDFQNMTYLNSCADHLGRVMVVYRRVIDDNIAIMTSEVGYTDGRHNDNMFFESSYNGTNQCRIVGDSWILAHNDFIYISRDQGQNFQKLPGNGITGISWQIWGIGYLENSIALWTDGEAILVVGPLGHAAISYDMGLSWQEYVAQDVFPIVSPPDDEPLTDYALFGPSLDRLLVSNPAMGRVDRCFVARVARDNHGLFYPSKARTHAGLTILVGTRNNPPTAYEPSSLVHLSCDGGFTYTPAGHFGVMEFVPRQIIGYQSPAQYRGISYYRLVLNMPLTDWDYNDGVYFERSQIMEQDDLVLVYRSSTGGLESLVLPALAGKVEADVSRTIAEAARLVSGPAYRSLAQERSTRWLSRGQALALLDELATTGQAWLWRYVEGDGWHQSEVVLDMKKYALQTRAGLASITVRWRENDAR